MNFSKILCAAVIIFSGLAFGSELSCSVLLIDKEDLISWRSGSTHSNIDVKTSASREEWLKKAEESMTKFITEKVDTPEMIFAAEEGVVTIAPDVAKENKKGNTIPLNYTATSSEQGFHYDQIPKVSVSNLGGSGILRGTLLLPVSAHTGLADAKKWSKTDTYSIYLEVAGGTDVPLIKDESSLDYVTKTEIEFKMQPNISYKLTYHRSGSGGPNGYPDGRILEIVWDGK